MFASSLNCDGVKARVAANLDTFTLILGHGSLSIKALRWIVDMLTGRIRFLLCLIAQELCRNPSF